MKGFRTIWRYAQVTVRDGLHNISTYMILGILFLVVQYYCPGIGRYLQENGDRMNLWELYVWSMSTRQAQLLYLAGIVGVACQSIRFHGGTALYLVRMNQKNWVRAQMLSLLLSIVGLNLFLLFCFAVACGGRITLAGEWSRAAFMGAQFENAEVIGLRGIFRISYSLLSFDPHMVGGLSFLLAVLLGMTMGLTMMVFALRRGTAFGGMVIFTLWILEVLAESMPMFRIFRYMLPFGLARVSYTVWNHGVVTPGYCVMFLLVLTVFWVWLNDWACKRMDFMKLE